MASFRLPWLFHKNGRVFDVHIIKQNHVNLHRHLSCEQYMMWIFGVNSWHRLWGTLKKKTSFLETQNAYGLRHFLHNSDSRLEWHCSSRSSEDVGTNNPKDDRDQVENELAPLTWGHALVARTIRICSQRQMIARTTTHRGASLN